MRVISIRENPQHVHQAIEYISSKWSAPRVVYDDCITHCISASSFLPQWYLLEKEERIIGCAGLITNDFISRMDLYPWLCGLFIEEEERGHGYAVLLIKKAMEDAANGGFEKLYLSTDHVGYYEKYGFEFIGMGYHPWNEESRIYGISLNVN